MPILKYPYLAVIRVSALGEAVSHLTECLEDKAGTVNPVAPAGRTRVNATAVHLLNSSPDKRPLLSIN